MLIDFVKNNLCTTITFYWVRRKMEEEMDSIIDNTSSAASPYGKTRNYKKRAPYFEKCENDWEAEYKFLYKSGIIKDGFQGTYNKNC